MGKALTTLTDEEREEAKQQVRALARENPTYLVVEVILKREDDVDVFTEWSKETGKWKLIRAQERWVDKPLCGVEMDQTMALVKANLANDSAKKKTS